MTTLETAKRIDREVRDNMNNRINEIEGMFQMGFINNVVKFNLTQIAKGTRQSYLNLSK